MKRNNARDAVAGSRMGQREDFLALKRLSLDRSWHTWALEIVVQDSNVWGWDGLLFNNTSFWPIGMIIFDRYRLNGLLQYGLVGGSPCFTTQQVAQAAFMNADRFHNLASESIPDPANLRQKIKITKFFLPITRNGVFSADGQFWNPRKFKRMGAIVNRFVKSQFCPPSFPLDADRPTYFFYQIISAKIKKIPSHTQFSGTNHVLLEIKRLKDFCDLSIHLKLYASNRQFQCVFTGEDPGPGKSIIHRLPSNGPLARWEESG